jgi:two-component system, response regulator YesN
MIRVVIVDDEPLILRSIKMSIEQANEDYIIVGEAFDGEEALLVIERTQPDIVFTDIRMPVIDGLELIEELRKRKSRVLPVILSGYQEFDYAKKGIKLGVNDYLLKPINPEILTKLLNELGTEVTQMKRNQQLNALTLFVNNHMISEEIKIDIPLSFREYKSFLCIFICSGSYGTYTFSQSTPSNDYWMKISLEDILIKLLGEKENFWLINGEHGNEKIVILGSSISHSSRFFDIALCLHNELRTAKLLITTIYSNAFHSIEELPMLIKNMKTFMHRKNIFGESCFEKYFHNAISNYSNFSIDSIYKEESLKFLIQNGQISQLRILLRKIINTCYEQRYPQYMLEKLLKQIFNTLSVIMHSELNFDEIVDELISNSNNYEDIYNNMLSVIEEIFILTKSENSIEATINKIEQYINTNYSNQVSLQAIASMFELNPSSMSSLYRKYKGISPVNHIINLRMEKAKELLMIQPPMRIKDISDAVGYDDQYYFSRIFKNVVGKNPSDFRE